MQVNFSTFSLQKRLLVLLILIAFIFCAVCVRLFFLQGVNSQTLQSKAAAQWLRKLPLTASRGKIIDNSGSSLALTYTTYDVYVRARNVQEPLKVTELLSELFDINYDRLYEKVLNKQVSEVLIKLDANEDDSKKIVNANLSGIVMSENIARYYPYGNFLSQVLGFITSDNVGQAGLEAYYNTYLKGSDGKALSQSDVAGINLDGTLSYYIPSVAGLNLQLTIDSKIQLIAENALSGVIDEHKPKSASVIVMNPNNGQILAMAMAPSLDNNNLPRDDVETLLKYSKNTTVTDVYEPGSTFKILTMCAALEEGLTHQKEHFYCPGYRMVDGQKIKCWKTIGHGTQTLVEGIVNSCNCVFMDLASRLGKDKLYKYLQAFGIGSTTGVDILGESSGILMNKSSVQNVDLARIGFGQAVAVTQLQLLSAFCAAINGGMLYSPYLVDNIYNDSGLIIKQNSSTILNKTISQTTSQTMNYLLSQVLNMKGGENSYLTGYDVGGKTGTAQKYENGVIASGKYVSSFFGCYPTNNPEYAILICVDEPSSGQYYGSIVASPYGKQIISGIINYKNIPKDSGATVANYIAMPNLIGYSIVDAMITLNKLGIHYEVDGEGGKVLAQFPAGGTSVLSSASVLIST